MFDLLPVSLLGLPSLFSRVLPSSSAKDKRVQSKMEAASAMWQAVLALDRAFPLGASLFLDVNIKDDNYIGSQGEIKEFCPDLFDKNAFEAFDEQWVKFYDECQRQRPYLDRQFYDLLSDFASFLQNSCTVAKYHGILQDMSIDIVINRAPRSLNRKQKKQYRKCMHGRECRQILIEAICETVQKL